MRGDDGDVEGGGKTTGKCVSAQFAGQVED